MIGRIEGQLVEVIESTVLLNCAGVCYELELTTTALSRLPPANSNVQIYTHFVVREDAQLLYGFANRDERDLFRALIRINGVGPKLAQSIISSVGIGDLVRSVQDGDLSMLTRVPGVGRKTAERLLVELKNRLSDMVVVGEIGPPSSVSEAALEATHALVALGYKRSEAERVVGSVDVSDASTEEIVRAALKRIARQAEAAG